MPIFFLLRLLLRRDDPRPAASFSVWWLSPRLGISYSEPGASSFGLSASRLFFLPARRSGWMEQQWCRSVLAFKIPHQWSRQASGDLYV